MRVPLLRNRLHRRRGLIALFFATAIMGLLFMMTSAFVLTVAGSGVANDLALRGSQAVYAAEAGLDLALQRGPTTAFAGQVGRGEFAVKWQGARLVAVGQARRAQGAPIRRAIEVATSGGRPVRGTWRQVPPATEPDLIALLAPQAPGPGSGGVPGSRRPPARL
jgi:hypothetical protein